MSAPVTLPASYTSCPRCNHAWRVGTRSSCTCVRLPQTGMDDIEPTVAAPKKKSRATCLFGHGHDSAGEATTCPMVYRRASDLGLTTFRPGKPGIPCFRVAPDDDGRPAYVSVDWVLVNAAGRIVLLCDYKGSVAKSLRFDKGWARGKRIVEAETGAKCVELAKPEEALTLTLTVGGAS